MRVKIDTTEKTQCSSKGAGHLSVSNVHPDMQMVENTKWKTRTLEQLSRKSECCVPLTITFIINYDKGIVLCNPFPLVSDPFNNFNK